MYLRIVMVVSNFVSVGVTEGSGLSLHRSKGLPNTRGLLSWTIIIIIIIQDKHSVKPNYFSVTGVVVPPDGRAVREQVSERVYSIVILYSGSGSGGGVIIVQLWLPERLCMLREVRLGGVSRGPGGDTAARSLVCNEFCQPTKLNSARLYHH